jgi:hypothetical protein
VRLALATGAGSDEGVSSGFGGVMTGRMVERDSGSRRVRKRVDDCRYILEIWDEACRKEVELEREEMEEVRRVSRVGLRVVAMEPLEVMALTPPWWAD